MVFGILAGVNLPESRKMPHCESRKPLKPNDDLIGPVIATRRVPVMYRLLDEFLPAQRTRDARQEQPPTKRPSKGKPAGEASSRRGGNNHRPQLLGRPVTSAGQRNAAPIGVAFSASGAEWGLCLPRWSPIPGLARAGRRKLHLPAGLLRCNIGLAYQAADAGHPKRAEQARRRTRKFLRAVYFIAGCKRRELP
jgi:hypothetical protein